MIPFRKMSAQNNTHHILLIGDPDSWQKHAVDYALTYHFPSYEINPDKRTRISVVVSSEAEIHDFVFEYQELMDNSYWRIVDLSDGKPKLSLHRPLYEGTRKDFVDVEWEFIIGRLSNPILQEKIRRWSVDPKQKLIVSFCYSDNERNAKYAEKLRRRLSDNVKFEIHNRDEDDEKKRQEELMEMAKYLNYFYQASYELQHVPTELPEEEVNKAWDTIKDEKLKRSNIFNVMSIPLKMEILGHDRNDWDTFYALTADEIERLTAVEHNRWTVERLIQGMRPCTEQERKEIEFDLQKRLSDPTYAQENPISLKKKYKIERNAHFDICAFSELRLDETGLPVTRYDRDLTAAIPLIVKTFNDRRKNG